MKDRQWENPANTRAGRVERAVAVFQDGQRRGLMVSAAMAYLADKVSESELMEALNIASGGELINTALG